MKINLKVGDSVTRTRVFTEDDIIQFANISTDTNPIHLDKKYAESSIFGQRIVHGALIASLFSGLIGTKLPGKGAIYLQQNLNFKAPVSIGSQVTALVEIVKIRDDKPIITLKTICFTFDGQVAVEGEAVVKVI